MVQESNAFTLDPVPPSRFVGRAEGVGEVLSRALEPTPPLQSLDGPSKIGRTSMLHYLRAISRGEIQHPALENRQGCLIAPHIDLTLRHQENGRAEKLIYDAIVNEIRTHRLPAPNLREGAATSAGIVARMKELKGEGHSFVLLADRGEHLLTTGHSDDRARQKWSDTAMGALAKLNEQVPISVVLAFGATGPATDVRPRARRLKMIEAIHVLSHMLTRGNATRTTMDLLSDMEVRGFVEGAGHLDGTGSGSRLNPAEVDWLVEVAGGHPLVMQNAGLRLLAASGDNGAERRHEVEHELADGLQGFLVDVFLRIDPVDREGLAALEELGGGGSVKLAPELAEILEDEGLIRRVDASTVSTMPSGALRAALLSYLADRRAVEVGRSRHAVDSQAQSRTPKASLALAGTGGGVAVQLTRSEHVLISELLAAGDQGIASRADLRAALGRNTDDPQLNQRVSVLRNKIEQGLGVEDAIESVYGRGYRLNDHARYELRPGG